MGRFFGAMDHGTRSWKDDKLHGYGQFHWKDGCAYVGKYKEGKRVAIGAYYFRNGTKFTGDMSQAIFDYERARQHELYRRSIRRRVLECDKAARSKDRAKPSVASREIPSGRGKIVWQDGSTEGHHLDGYHMVQEEHL